VTIAGIVGAGLVWGWLLVLLVDQRPNRARPQPPAEAADGRSQLVRRLDAFVKKWQTERRPYLNLLAVALFTSVFAWLIYTLNGATLLIPFFLALIMTFAIHLIWRERLRQGQKRSS
jgi:Flp pilus assembly protein TadB